MELDPQLRALREDDTPQRVAQISLHRAVADWRSASGGAVLDGELSALEAGASLDSLPMLSALYDGADPSAATLLASLTAAICAALDRAPLGQLPLRHFTDGTVSTLLIGRCAGVSLVVSLVDGLGFARKAEPLSVSYSPNESWERILAGTAQAEFVDRRPAGGEGSSLRVTPIELAPGTVIVRDNAQRALRMKRIEGCLVILRLQRRRMNEVTCEYGLADGSLLHQAASNPRDSRLELAAALLGRMGRRDAAPLMAALALEEGSPALRWQVLRECLALDTGEGFRALTAVARTLGDPLAVPAGALRAQLIEQYPVLLEIESCRA